MYGIGYHGCTAAYYAGYKFEHEQQKVYYAAP